MADDFIWTLSCQVVTFRVSVIASDKVLPFLCVEEGLLMGLRRWAPQGIVDSNAACRRTGNALDFFDLVGSCRRRATMCMGLAPETSDIIKGPKGYPPRRSPA